MIVYTINLDYRCNEACVFCAADLAGPVPIEVRKPSLGAAQVERWLGADPPGLGDRVNISGGEPTLHRDLLRIVRTVSTSCPNVALFTNAVRLADAERAAAVVDAGVRTFEISLFGAEPATHDAVTQRRGSFKKTMTALQNLTVLRRRRPIIVAVRLLAARQTAAENPGIVSMVVAAGVEPDWFSINKSILSKDAMAVGAPISWASARQSVNETVRRARQVGHLVSAPTVPHCVFDDESRSWLAAHPAPDGSPGAERVEYRYLDPLQAQPGMTGAPRSRPALPDVCVGCCALAGCPRVDRGYLRVFGTQGLSTVTTQRVASG